MDDMEADMAEVKNYLESTYNAILVRMNVVFVVVVALAMHFSMELIL